MPVGKCPKIYWYKSASGHRWIARPELRIHHTTVFSTLIKRPNIKIHPYHGVSHSFMQLPSACSISNRSEMAANTAQSQVPLRGRVPDVRSSPLPNIPSVWIRKNQLDVTFCILYFSSNSCSTCFRRPCAHHQELTTAWWYSLVLVCAVAAGRLSSPVGR